MSVQIYAAPLVVGLCNLSSTSDVRDEHIQLTSKLLASLPYEAVKRFELGEKDTAQKANVLGTFEDSDYALIVKHAQKRLERSPGLVALLFRQYSKASHLANSNTVLPNLRFDKAFQKGSFKFGCVRRIHEEIEDLHQDLAKGKHSPGTPTQHLSDLLTQLNSIYSTSIETRSQGFFTRYIENSVNEV